MNRSWSDRDIEHSLRSAAAYLQGAPLTQAAYHYWRSWETVPSDHPSLSTLVNRYRQLDTTWAGLLNRYGIPSDGIESRAERRTSRRAALDAVDNYVAWVNNTGAVPSVKGYQQWAATHSQPTRMAVEMCLGATLKSMIVPCRWKFVVP